MRTETERHRISGRIVAVHVVLEIRQRQRPRDRSVQRLPLILTVRPEALSQESECMREKESRTRRVWNECKECRDRLPSRMTIVRCAVPAVLLLPREKKSDYTAGVSIDTRRLVWGDYRPYHCDSNS
jgi:hypothetical protein